MIGKLRFIARNNIIRNSCRVYKSRINAPPCVVLSITEVQEFRRKRNVDVLDRVAVRIVERNDLTRTEPADKEEILVGYGM